MESLISNYYNQYHYRTELFASIFIEPFCMNRSDFLKFVVFERSESLITHKNIHVFFQFTNVNLN